ncbi:MAG: gamma-glutamyltransferase [Aliidongia sp.]
MAGTQAMHDRFGKLPFDTLFQPALWYAEHGVTISLHLAKFFQLRESFLSKSPEGLAFLHQAATICPKRAIISCSPNWPRPCTTSRPMAPASCIPAPGARAFVAAVQKGGGKATAADLADYRPNWNEPYIDEVFGHTVYVNGAPNLSVYQVVTGLNMAEALKLDQRGPYWSDPAAFRDLMRISDFVSPAPNFDKQTADFLHAKGIDTREAGQRKKAFATSAAPLLDQFFTAGAGPDNHHSNSIVVVDKAGNIAVMTHTINAVIWGDTGIVVGGIPLPNSAGFQQERLAQHKPGDRLPNEIAVTLTVDGKKPVLATAPIGASLVPETIRLILGVVGQKQDLASVVAAPALRANLGDAAKALSDRAVMVPADAYGADFLDQVKALGVRLQTVPAETARGLRGTLATAALDPKTGTASSPEVPGVMIFSGAE